MNQYGDSVKVPYMSIFFREIKIIFDLFVKPLPLLRKEVKRLKKGKIQGFPIWWPVIPSFDVRSSREPLFKKDENILLWIACDLIDPHWVE